MDRKHEQVLITDALAYLKERAGYDFERRQFTRWVEAGCITINRVDYPINTAMIGARWYISRESLDMIVAALTSPLDEAKDDEGVIP